VADIPETVVDDALAEIEEALAHIDPLLEGLQDFARLNLRPETLAVVQGAIDLHVRRRDKLVASRDALQVLLDDGYPFLPVHEIGQGAYDDLAENHTSIEAAFAHFKPNVALALGLTAGESEPKP
jgi:hypothetical protein